MNSIEYVRYLRQEAIARKFSFPKNFKKTSSARLVRCYNGIGAEWMPDWLRRIITEIFDRLKAPALLHDYEFTYAKKTVWNFLVANLRFAYNSAKCKRPILGIAGALFCTVFGWWAFKNGKELSK